MIRHFGQAYVDRMIELVMDYCNEFLYDAWKVEQDGRDRLIVYSDDWVHTQAMAEAMEDEGIRRAEVKEGGYQVHIQL